MVTEYIDHIRAVQPAGPYHLLGWSFGGAVVHAVAVRLQHQGEPVALLAMLDSTPIDSARGSNDLPDEHDILALPLEVTGHTPAEVDRPLNVPQVVAMLRGKNGHDDVLAAMLAAMEERHVAGFIEVYANFALRPTAVVGSFDGDLLYFQAMHDRLADTCRPSLAVVGGWTHRNSRDRVPAQRHDAASTAGLHRPSCGRTP